VRRLLCACVIIDVDVDGACLFDVVVVVVIRKDRGGDDTDD